MDEGLGALERGIFEDAASSDVVLVGPDPVEPEEGFGFFDPVREIHLGAIVSERGSWVKSQRGRRRQRGEGDPYRWP